MVHLCRTMQLAEPGEYLWEVFSYDPYSSINDMNHQKTKVISVLSPYFDRALACELEGVLHQVN